MTYEASNKTVDFAEIGDRFKLFRLKINKSALASTICAYLDRRVRLERLLPL